MRHFPLVCFLGMGLLARGIFADVRDVVDSLEFARAVEGVYEVVEVNGEAPKEENKEAEILVDVQEVILAMPYCPKNSSLCDPGYHFWDFSLTTLERHEEGNAVIFDIVHGKQGEQKRFEWMERDGLVYFTNFQYLLFNEQIELTHVLRRINPVERKN